MTEQKKIYANVWTTEEDLTILAGSPRIKEILTAFFEQKKCPKSSEDNLGGKMINSLSMFRGGGKKDETEWERLCKLLDGTECDYSDVVLDENGNLTRDENGKIIRKTK